METKLKISFALRNGAPIHISEVESGSKHGGICVECSRPLMARKGVRKRHHFGHQADVQCNPETVLHKIGKMLLCSQIESALSAGQQVPLTWKCSRCPDEHKGNLPRKARTVRLELALTGCRPNLTLLDEDNKPVAIIEIVVSHAPEEHVREFCKSHDIGLLEYHIKTDGDLEALRSFSEFHATLGSVCLRKKCPRCKAPVRPVMLHVVDGDCWKCKSAMKVDFTSCEGFMEGPPSFAPSTLALAKERGAILRERLSNVVKERYLANTCPRCGNLVGDFYLRDFWYAAHADAAVVAGYECSECEWGG